MVIGGQHVWKKSHTSESESNRSDSPDMMDYATWTDEKEDDKASSNANSTFRASNSF